MTLIDSNIPMYLVGAHHPHKAIVLGSPRLSARDAIHVAVMEHHGIARILSFDSAFERVPGITRLG